MLIRHETNTRGRDFFVGDLHGEYRLLQAALQDVDFDPETDRLFSVGDLIDRGEASLACLSLVEEPWFHAVMGNHEQMALEALEKGGSAWDLWMINGGDWVHGHPVDEVRQRLSAALHRMPLAREVMSGATRVGMVHAEPPTDWRRIEDTAPHTLLWGRERIERHDDAPVVGIDAVVVGHTIVERPLTLGNVHYLDTGAFLTGRLTLIEAGHVLAQ